MRRRIQGGWSRCEDSRGCRESSVPGTVSANVVLRLGFSPSVAMLPRLCPTFSPPSPRGKRGLARDQEPRPSRHCHSRAAHSAPSFPASGKGAPCTPGADRDSCLPCRPPVRAVSQSSQLHVRPRGAPQLLASTAAPRHPSQPPLLPAVASNWSPSSASPPLPPPIHFPRGPVRSWNPKI